MPGLTLTANLARPDDFYASLLRLHEGMDAAESTVLNAKLILLLANHIGNHDVLIEALDRARRPAA